MKIYVRTPAGQIAALEVEDADTIDSVKQKIQDQIGVLPARQQLTYADKALEDGRKLQDYSVPGDALLSLALQAAWALENAVFPAGGGAAYAGACTVTDSGGDAATGWVTISALAPASANFISAVYASGAPPSMTLKYAGIPGVAYAVQVSTDLASWATVQGSRTVVSASGASAGVASFVHENPPNPTAYYRTVQSP